MREKKSIVKFMLLLQPPLFLGLLAGALRSAPLFFLTAALVFGMAARIPDCRGNETLWVFVFSTVAFVPSDLALAGWCVRTVYHADSAAAALIQTMMYTLFLLNAELAAMCMAACLIWERKKKK